MEGSRPRPSIGCIILAAGANERLKTIVPSGMKPLILVNGRPLIHHALSHADVWSACSKTIVVSPTNATGITSVCPVDCNYVLQPRPFGVVDAIRRAIHCVTEDLTLILCADNLFVGDVPEIIDKPMIATRELPLEESRRFTRLKQRVVDPSTERESKIVPSRGVHLIEASSVELEPSTICWIGPLLLETRRLRAAADDPTLTVTEMIARASRDGFDLTPIPMQCSDCGIPEVL